MKYSKVKAIFNGLDKSLGYKHGKEYNLLVRQNTYTSDITISIVEEPSNTVRYSNIGKFFNNWKNISEIK